MDSEKATTTPPTPYSYHGDDDEPDHVDHTVSRKLKDDKPKDDNQDVQPKHDVDTDSDETPDGPADPICAGEADGPCLLGSGDHRKVISHLFGRNKRCTHQIPDDCWIKYCRKHYQRQKYRCPADWVETQLLLLDGHLDKMEAWGGIMSWTIAIRKKEREMLDHENSYFAQHGRLPNGPRIRERFLLPYLGSDKTFADVRHLVDVINRECDDTKGDQLPSFELLAVIDERRNPRPKRFGRARRLAQSGRASTPATFRLSTNATGQLLKTEASPSPSLLKTSGQIPHQTPPNSTAEKGTSHGAKRSTPGSDEDEDSSDTKHVRPVKRRHVGVTKVPKAGHARPAKQKVLDKLDNKATAKPASAIKRHARSLSVPVTVSSATVLK
ncbi:MAG: hypothetical protein Q9170_007479 [Blastenia crenularia]